ncbi:hypothetical protein BDN72DRAFT_435627 [Pluteus cervinus]|uniref:Uncharacterized protein n=1 Tax=Pluteus cervinus TaxID=181527 RepID=A0ACD3A7B9_9AGAR|nr:hypothetical protein BDN72DRAFT_435627 [Pluteus cervinus]
MPLEIPLEIIGEITVQLSKSRRALRSLALVSRAFLDPCQRHLFSVLRLCLPVSQESHDLSTVTPFSTVRLRDIFNHHPHLAGYVKSLFLSTSNSSNTGSTDGLFDYPSVFTDIVNFLASSPIHTITLEGPEDPPPFHWNRLPLGVERAMYRLFANPSVATLRMVYVIIPKTFFQAFGGLKVLVLIEVGWLKEDGSDSGFQGVTERVQKLKSIDLAPGRLGSSEDCLDLSAMTPERGLDLTAVEHAVWYTRDSVQAPFSLSPLNPANLKSFKLGVSNGMNGQPLDLSLFRRLSYLSITYLADMFDPLWIAEAIQSLPSNHHVRSLVLKFTNANDVPIDLFSSFELLRPALSQLHSASDSVKISLKIDLYDVLGNLEGLEAVKVKDYVFERVKWDGCEAVLQVHVSQY